MESCYWPEAWDDHGLFKGRAADLMALNRSLRDSGEQYFDHMSHHICNEWVTIAGDVAQGESSFIGFQGCTKDGKRQEYLMVGRYLDRFERRSDEWRIADRLVAMDWETMLPDTPGYWDPSPWVRGRPTPDDPIFARWKDLGQ